MTDRTPRTPYYEPTPEEIAARTADIRSRWGWRKFLATDEPPVETRLIDTSDLEEGTYSE